MPVDDGDDETIADVPLVGLTFVLFGFFGDDLFDRLWKRKSSQTVMATWTAPFPSRTSAAQQIRF